MPEMVKPSEEIVIVTGSSGLIGSAVCHALEERGFRTFGFDRPGLPHPPDITEAVNCDVTSQESIEKAVATVKRDGGAQAASVVHLAAYYDFAGEESDLYEKVTVRGTERLLKTLQAGGMRIEQFLFSSTMLVHKPGEPGDRITEETPLEATWDYPKSKIETERVLREQHGDIPVGLLRVAGVYTDDCESVPIAHQIQRIYEKDFTSRVFPGDTDAGQSFVHLDDVVESICLCVERRAQLPPVTAILIGEEDVMSYRELQHALGELIHDKDQWPTLQIPKPVAKAGAYVQDKLPGIDPFIKPWMIDRADDHYALDTSRARHLLGWRPTHSLRETLPKMIESLKRDPAAFYAKNNLEGEPPTSD